MVEVEPNFDLPDNCWEHIFTFLNDEDDKDNRCCLKSVSVVSKQFLSITNLLRSSFTIKESSGPILAAIFDRFPNITSLSFSPLLCGDLDAILSEISCYFPALNITSLNLINQLYIPVDGLRAFSEKIKSLTCLDCSHMNSIRVTDMSLIAECFPLLEELYLHNIAIFHCSMLNDHGGIETLSLALSKLRKIDLSGHTYMNDQSLFHLFNNCKLLEEAIIFDCFGITNAGIGSALGVSRPTFKSLSLTNYFDNCSTLLAIVIRSCPSLSDIKIEHRGSWETNYVDNSLMNFNVVSSDQLKSLCLAGNTWLNDQSLAYMNFPNLQKLDLSHCYQISEEGICQLLRTCSKIRHLNLSHTQVDDETLYVISKSCRGLLQLSLEDCYFVTEKGVNHVVENCTQLKEINWNDCGNNVDKNNSSSNSLTFQRLREFENDLLC
ncbi:F-box/LRR-repeat protein [Trifolium repens]|nr:F-box/LRR-repeat protein [Trifolium repens]